jgi:EpsI family protein
MPSATDARRNRRILFTGSFAPILSCLALTLILVTLVDFRKPDALSQPLQSIGSEIAGWKLLAATHLPESQLNVLKPSSYLSREYGKSGQRLELFIAYYDLQRAGESMHSPRVCLPGSGWEIFQRGVATVPLDRKYVQINEFHIRKAGTPLRVLYWYQSRNRVVASEYMGKFSLLQDAIMSGKTSGSIVRAIFSADSPSIDGIDFVRSLIPQIQRCFGNR